MMNLFLLAGLASIMLSLGLVLTVDDFKRALTYPRAVLIALFCQTLLMPAFCFFLAKSFGLGPEMAVGLMLLAATPGGVLANIYSHLAGGDVALNITLTAINSLLSLFTLPLLLGFSLQHFLAADRAIPMQTGKVIQVLLLVVIPVIVGMYLRHLRPGMAERLKRPVKIFSLLFVVLAGVAVAIQQWRQLIDYFPLVGSAVVLFNIASLLSGYAIALLVKLERRQAIAIGMEVGVHNGALAIGLALSPMILNNAAMAIPATVYGILSLFIAPAFAAIVGRKKAKP